MSVGRSGNSMSTGCDSPFSMRCSISRTESRYSCDGLANSLPGAFETSDNAVGNFSNLFTYDLGLDYYAKYTAQVRAVTGDQAQTVAQK